MAIKKEDFVEIEYTGRLKEEKIVFDTTDEKTAKENGLHSEKSKYGPIVICIGEGHLLKGLDENLEGKETGKHVIELKPEDAFGKKNAKLIQFIPAKKFTEQNINPVPGLQVNVDGILGIIRKVGGGRVIIDFNHPLSGKEIVYEVDVKRIVTDKREKVNALIKIFLGEDPETELKEGKAIIKIKTDLPDKASEEIVKKIKELAGIKEVEIKKFEDKKEKEPEEKT